MLNVQSIAAGRVTDDLLPDVVRDGIAASTRDLGYDVPSLKWIRWHAHAQFLYESQREMVYRVQIPLIEKTTYFLYNIKPLPVLQKDVLAEVQARTPILYNTLNGEVAHPKDCVGRDPTICEPIVKWTVVSFQCELGIINNFALGKTACEWSAAAHKNLL